MHSVHFFLRKHVVHYRHESTTCQLKTVSVESPETWLVILHIPNRVRFTLDEEVSVIDVVTYWTVLGGLYFYLVCVHRAS